MSKSAMQTNLEDYDELEDGEISSGEDELTARPSLEIHANSSTDNPTGLMEEYEILERPIASARRTLEREFQGSSRTMGIDHHFQNQPARPTRPTPMKSKMFENQKDDDDEEGKYDDSSSQSSTDSDDDGPSGKKVKRMLDPQFCPPKISLPMSSNQFDFSTSAPATNSLSEPMDNDAFKHQAVEFQQKRKPNNVWSSVLQDELVSDIFGKVNVEEYNDTHIRIDRGPESFSVTYAARPPIRQRSDSSSLSSGGLTDNEFEYLKGLPAEEAEVPEFDETGETFVKHFGPQHRYSRRKNSQKRRQRKKRKNRMVHRMRRMTAIDLSQYIAEKLSEPKVELVTRTIEILGKENCISLFLKTMKIERRGGLMIMNQQRRRTPGGVFFYILRGDGRFSKRLVDRIFQSDRQLQTKSRKREHQSNRRKKMELLGKKKLDLERDLNNFDAGIMTGNSGEETESVQVNQVEMKDLDDDGGHDSLPEDDESNIDSDEFYGIHQKTDINDTGILSRSIHQDEDCIDIHCDPSDLN